MQATQLRLIVTLPTTNLSLQGLQLVGQIRGLAALQVRLLLVPLQLGSLLLGEIHGDREARWMAPRAVTVEFC